MTATEQLELLAKAMREAKNVVVMTGAGMSTPSGLKDFRGKGGMWENKSVYDIANIYSIRPRQQHEPIGDYKKRINAFTSFYQMRIKEVVSHKPNAGHHLLSKWEYMNLITGVITQNTDGYHEQAGSTTLAIHGRLTDIYCSGCNSPISAEVYMTVVNPKCAYCGGTYRPGVVLFDEDLPPVFETAMSWAMRSDFMLVLGSSLMVRPANRLPMMTIENGGKVGVVSYKYRQQGDFSAVVIRDKDVVEAIQFLNGRIHKSSWGV